MKVSVSSFEAHKVRFKGNLLLLSPKDMLKALFRSISCERKLDMITQNVF